MSSDGQRPATWCRRSWSMPGTRCYRAQDWRFRSRRAPSGSPSGSRRKPCSRSACWSASPPRTSCRKSGPRRCPHGSCHQRTQCGARRRTRSPPCTWSTQNQSCVPGNPGRGQWQLPCTRPVRSTVSCRCRARMPHIQGPFRAGRTPPRGSACFRTGSRRTRRVGCSYPLRRRSGTCPRHTGCIQTHPRSRKCCQTRQPCSRGWRRSDP